MREYRQKQKLRQRIFSKVTILLLAVVFFFLAKATYNVYQKDAESAANLARVNASLADTKERYDSLQKETERLQTTAGLEEEVRHKYQVSKEGEKVIIVIDDQSGNDKSATSTSFFSRLKYAILNFIKK